MQYPAQKKPPVSWSQAMRALRRPLLIALVVASAVHLHRAGTNVQAATLPGGFAETQIATGLSSPTAMAFAPDGRLFVAEQGGRLRVIKNGVLLPTPFVTLTVDSFWERGLLGVAFDPNFAVNQYVYVYYTAPTTPRHNRVVRFTASGDVAVPGSETLILRLDDLNAWAIHNGGAMHFGPDGKLYIAVGENATPSNAQTLDNLLGKVLRIDPDGSIPRDNPFYNQASGNNRAIWALGLRNPFTFAFQPRTGRMFINDVGQWTWEEINEGAPGANYGWPEIEGPRTTQPLPRIGTYRDPLYAYGRSEGCAIVGAAFYNPPVNQFPAEYIGNYFFADYCAGWIRRYIPATGAVLPFATGITSPVDIKIGPDGSLYYLTWGSSSTSGAVYRVSFTGSQAPSIGTHPVSQTVSLGQTATFTVSASGAPPLSYQWQKNGVNIPGAITPSYTTPPATAADNGATFRVIVSNAFGSATSNPATLTVTSNMPPTATITAPADGTLYSAGQIIQYAGVGTDPEDGNLPASAFTWRVDFHHDTHTHPFIPETSGIIGGFFTIPTTGETSANVWYRIHLTVRDSGGLTHSTFRDVRPRTVRLTLTTNPSGLRLTLDDQPVTAPITVMSVVGLSRSIGAVSPQLVGRETLVFQSWSDGGAATHTITTPSVDTTYTATFVPAGSLPPPPTPTPTPRPPCPPGMRC